MARKMIEKQIQSALPTYLAAAVFVAAAIVLPVYRVWAFCCAAALSGLAFLAARKKIAPRTVLVPAPATIYATGEQSLDTTLSAAEEDLAMLAQLNEKIADAALSANITRMEKAGSAILAAVAKNPAKGREIRKFAGYYLPTSIKILTTYADLAASGAAGENALGVMRDVQKNADTIATAFEAQLDALFSGEVLDVSSDITVLDAMAKGDGLAGKPQEKSRPTDPKLTL